MIDSNGRQELLSRAITTAKNLSPQAAKQAASALGILRRNGTTGLLRALRVRPPSGATERHWLDFANQVTPAVVRDIEAAYNTEGLALFLGWIKWLGTVSAATPRHQPRSKPLGRTR